MPDVPAAIMKFISIGTPSIFLGLLITEIGTALVGYYPFPLGVALIPYPNYGAPHNHPKGFTLVG
jgi:hypothetical protein